MQTKVANHYYCWIRDAHINIPHTRWLEIRDSNKQVLLKKNRVNFFLYTQSQEDNTAFTIGPFSNQSYFSNTRIIIFDRNNKHSE